MNVDQVRYITDQLSASRFIWYLTRDDLDLAKIASSCAQWRGGKLPENRTDEIHEELLNPFPGSIRNVVLYFTYLDDISGRKERITYNLDHDLCPIDLITMTYEHIENNFATLADKHQIYVNGLLAYPFNRADGICPSFVYSHH
jgi:hypothetical protein